MTTGRGVYGGAAGGLESRWKQGVIKGGCSGSQYGEEDTGNPTGPPKASPGLQGGTAWDRAGLGYHEETQQLFRVVKEFNNRRTRLQRGVWRSQEEGVRERKPRAFCGGENEEYKRPVGLLAWVAAEERGINVSPRTASQSAFDPIFPSQLPKTGPSPACNFQWLPTAQSSKGYLLTPASKASTSQAQPIVLA